MYITLSLGSGEIHVIWDISYYTSRGLYTIFLTDVCRKWQIQMVTFGPEVRKENCNFELQLWSETFLILHPSLNNVLFESLCWKWVWNCWSIVYFDTLRGMFKIISYDSLPTLSALIWCQFLRSCIKLHFFYSCVKVSFERLRVDGKLFCLQFFILIVFFIGSDPSRN